MIKNLNNEMRAEINLSIIRPPHIYLCYALYALVYAIIAIIIFEPGNSNTNNVFISILTSIGNTIYWVSAIFYFLISTLIISIAGLIIFRNNRRLKKTFMVFAIIAGSLLITMIVASYF